MFRVENRCLSQFPLCSNNFILSIIFLLIFLQFVSLNLSYPFVDLLKLCDQQNMIKTLLICHPFDKLISNLNLHFIII